MNIDVFYDTTTNFDQPQHPLVIEDVVSMARCTLETAGAVAALYWVDLLKDVISQKTWRSEAAADVLQEIHHGAIIEVGGEHAGNETYDERVYQQWLRDDTREQTA